MFIPLGLAACGGSSSTGGCTMPDCQSNCAPSTYCAVHSQGDPVKGATFWAAAGCDSCHGRLPSDVSFDGSAGDGVGPHYSLAYYASKPSNLQTALGLVTASLMEPYKARTVSNQDHLSAWFASLMTPVLINPSDSILPPGAYRYQISAPDTADYLVATTTYGVSATGRLNLSVDASGLVSGVLPKATTETTYAITLSARNGGASTGAGTASVRFNLTVR